MVTYPVTLDFAAWFAGGGIFALLVVGGIAVWAFRAALAGRPLFKSALLD